MGETIEATRPITAAEFQALPDDGRRLELVRGEVVEVSGPNPRHALIVARMIRWLGGFVDDHRLGAVTAEVGCQVAQDPDSVRFPDVAYWSGDRLSAGNLERFATAPPDLVVEVVSPNDKRTDVYRKVAMWLAAGVQVVWVVWPESRTVQVYRDDADPVSLGAGDTLTGGDLLPGLALPLAPLFAEPAAAP